MAKASKDKDLKTTAEGGAAPKKAAKQAAKPAAKSLAKSPLKSSAKAAAKPEKPEASAAKTAKKAAAPKSSAKTPAKKAAAKAPAKKAVAKTAAPKPAATTPAAAEPKAVKKTAAKSVVKKAASKPAESKAAATARPAASMAKLPPRNGQKMTAREIAAERAGLISLSPHAVLTRERDLSGREGEPVYPSAAPAREWASDFGATYLSLLVRDPQWLYAHWEISAEDREQYGIGRPQGASPLVLRVKETGGAAVIEMTVNLYARGWYVAVPEAGRRWRAELGIIGESGAFEAICQSHEVAAPREMPAPAAVEPDFEPVDEAASAELFRLSAGEDLGGGLALVTEADGQTFAVAGLSLTSPQALSSAEVARRRALSAMPGGAVAPGASEHPHGAPGAAKPAGEAPADFYLWVNCELIVYGGTEPDAKLTVQGRAVDLREDGTFSLRFALPDVEQIIPVRAIKADASQERTVTPIVRRTTE